MIRKLMPHLRLARVLELQLEHLRERGIEGLLLDVDCTLKDYKAEVFPAEVLAWVRGLGAAGFRICLLSNGRPDRIELLARQLGLPFVAKAYKPLPFGCRVAARKLGLRCDQIALVGDQLFADVLAGRLAGLYTVLVQPTSPEEPWFTRLKRPLERRVLRMFPGDPIAVEIPLASPQTGESTS